MKALSIKRPNVYLDFGERTLAVYAGTGLVLPLERQLNGRLTPACVEQVARDLRRFLSPFAWGFSLRASVAISARGVSLRRVKMPPTSDAAELQRLLRLQIEREFPLGPEDLAWGYSEIRNAVPGSDGGGGQELLLVAVNKELLDQYAQLLATCRLIPQFTVGALARNALIPLTTRPYAILELGSAESELLLFEHGAPHSLRVLRHGLADLPVAPVPVPQSAGVESSVSELVESPARGLERLAAAIRNHWQGPTLYLLGNDSRLAHCAHSLATVLGDHARCEWVQVPPGTGRTSAIAGLEKAQASALPSLPLLRTPVAKPATFAPAGPWPWVAFAAVLLVALLLVRYGESFLHEGRLKRRIAEVQAYRDKLPKIDHELAFLQFLQSNQPPYLEAVFTLANAAPAGARLETLSLNRRGDVAMRGTLKDSQQVVDFRSKLIESGFFASVVVEEQTPTPDRQKLIVRLSGKWKPAGERKPGAPLPASAGPAKPASLPAAPSAPPDPNAPSPIPNPTPPH